MKVTKIFAKLIGLLALASATHALAYNNACVSTNGSPTSHSFNFNQQIGDPIIAVGNTYLNDFYRWSSSSKPTMLNCNCDENDNQRDYIWATATSSLTPADTVNNVPYYYINDYIDVATKIIFGGTNGAYVPFQVDALSSTGQPTFMVYCKNIGRTTRIMWGNEGVLSLRIKKPFIGEIVIPPTEVARIYASWRDKLTDSASPVITVVLSGIVTVPENCEINAGQIINVNFSNAQASEFNHAGQKPASVEPRINDLSYSCRGLYGKNIAMRFMAETDSHYHSAIKTTDDNIGIIIENSNGTIIQPNSGLLPITVDSVTGKGSVTIKSYPISTTGQIPALGDYSGMATIRIDFQ